MSECRLYQPWAAKKFLQSGGVIKQQTVQHLSEISDKFDVVVNCAGLGAKYLCEDRRLVPIRGQVIKVHAPWIKTAFYGDYDTYIVPGFEGVTLGGCRQYDSYDLKVSKYDSMAIRERCQSMLPALKSAPVLRELVGLRPHRDPVRVEMEVVKSAGGNSSKIVHNYGHGGYGVTTAPGTAKYAVGLVRECLVGNSKL